MTTGVPSIMPEVHDGDSLGQMSRDVQKSKYVGGKLSSGATGSFFSAKSNLSDINSGISIEQYAGGGNRYTSPLTQAMKNGTPEKASGIVASTGKKKELSEYLKLLKERDLVPEVETELNWSGKKPGQGQHTEFKPNEEIPLQVFGLIGQSLTAKVEKVQCRRIMLARKSMHCTRRLKLADAIREVEHLQRLRHAHVIQLVGTYVQGKVFAILLYPVADLHLQDFILQVEAAIASKELKYGDFGKVASLGTFFRCLASTLR